MEELLEVLKGIKPEIDFENEENLIEDELLDSFDPKIRGRIILFQLEYLIKEGTK